MNKLTEYLESQFKEEMKENEQELAELCRAIIVADGLTDEQSDEVIEREFPFLNEKQSLHERVEDIMINRLSISLPEDKDVNPEVFEDLMTKLKGLIHNIATERLVTGFTYEDMESFMALKVHQVLRRNQYDFNRDPKKFFAFVFTNLINDINRCKNRSLKFCDNDALHDCLSLDKQEGQPFELA